MKYFIIVLLAILFFLMCNIDRTAYGPDAPKIEKQKIAFVSDRDGNDEIYTMDIDGNNQTRLTTNPGVDKVPQFSPDGSKIAYISHRNDVPSLFIMNTDGSGKKELVPNKEGFPIFSPDGQKVVFHVGGSLVLVNIDGSTLLIETSGYFNYLFPPAIQFSPDGQLILFSLDWYKSGNNDICTLNADGSNLLKLTIAFDTEYDGYPSFSNSGEYIIYRAFNRTDNFGNIRRMNFDGSNNISLSADSLIEPILPIYSPDDSKIIFTDEGQYFNKTKPNSVKGRPALFSMNADGSNPIQISDVGTYSTDAVFLPNGIEIIFPERRQIVCDNLEGTNRRIISDLWASNLQLSGKYIFGTVSNSLYRMNFDGTDVLLLTDNQIDRYYFTIQPINE